MWLFDKILKWITVKPNETVNYLSNAEIEQQNKALLIRFEQAKDLFAKSLSIYNSKYCQCVYPRFQQIIGIDCGGIGKTFKCHDTELLINLSKSYFLTSKSELTDECLNEEWICKKCGSVYEYGWSDFSIYVDRHKLELKDLKVNPKGREVKEPIPLFIGLMGHSYPSDNEMISVSFDEFENYMTEQ